MSHSRGYDNGDASSTTTAGMFSYPSSPLFEQPFVNRDFYAEQTPLRSRSSAGSPENNFSSTNPYFGSPERRKRSFHHYLNRSNNNTQHSQDRWVKQVMRLVLLSPLIVLVLWSAFAIMFSSSSSRRQQVAKTPRGVTRDRMQEGLLGMVDGQSPMQPLQQSALPLQVLQQPQPLQTLQRPLGQPFQLQPQGDTLQLQSLGDTQQMQPMGDSQQLQPLGNALQLQPLGNALQLQPLGNALQLQPLGNALQLQPLGNTLQLQPLGNALQLQPLGNPQPMQPLGEPLVVQQPLGYSQGMQPEGLQQRPPAEAQPLQPLQRRQPQKTASRAWIQNLLQRRKVAPANKLMSSSHQNLVVQPQRLQGSTGSNIEYYYYDPRSLVKGKDGKVYLPGVVYDQSGNPLETNKMIDRRGQATQVFFQPPPLFGSTPGDVLSVGNDVSPPGNVPDPVKGISMSDLKDVVKLAEERYQENSYSSSVIVTTVAVMALLVGALSARRMRGRATSALSACIENEHLDHVIDDAATDTNTAYSTFHWKGDVEKFDV